MIFFRGCQETELRQNRVTERTPLVDTVRAVQIVAALQKFSPVGLPTNFTTLKQATASPDPAILISADGKPTPLALDPAVQFGSLQTVFDGKRTVVVATSNGAAGQVDELLRWLSAEAGRWPELDGKAIVSVPGQLPVTVSIAPSGDFGQGPQLVAANQQQESSSAWWAGGGVVAIAATGILAILLTSRRKESSRDGF